MARDALPDSDRLPAEIRDLALRLREDLATLRLKWSSYRELFGSRENTRLLTDTARACFQMVEESLRHDIILSVCRLSDPTRTLGGESPSFATLVAQCGNIPRAEDLLIAFQAACGSVRRYRHRHLGHNDPEALIEPREHLLPDHGGPHLKGFANPKCVNGTAVVAQLAAELQAAHGQARPPREQHPLPGEPEQQGHRHDAQRVVGLRQQPRRVDGWTLADRLEERELAGPPSLGRIAARDLEDVDVLWYSRGRAILAWEVARVWRWSVVYAATIFLWSFSHLELGVLLVHSDLLRFGAVVGDTGS